MIQIGVKGTRTIEMLRAMTQQELLEDNGATNGNCSDGICKKRQHPQLDLFSMQILTGLAVICDKKEEPVKAPQRNIISKNCSYAQASAGYIRG